MAAEAVTIREWNDVKKTLAAAVAAGEVHQLRDGTAGYLKGLRAAASGDLGAFETRMQVTCPKGTGYVLLDGGRAYWDYANNRVSYKRTSARDFYLGRIVGDAASGDTTCAVNLNVPEHLYDRDLARDSFTSALVGTQAAGGFGGPHRRGGTHKLAVSATNEAQKVDALGDEGFPVTCKGILEMKVNVVSLGSGGAPDFNVGLASATHATDADAIAKHLFLHVDGNSTQINFQSKDGVTTVAAVNSTVALTAGTPFEVWFDLRDPTSVKVYVDGVRVLTGTTFDVSNASGTLYLLAHLEKTSATDTFDADVWFLRLRTAEQ